MSLSQQMNEKPSFLAYPKWRNVYKVAVAYAFVGWLLVQVATQVFPIFEIPNWVLGLNLTGSAAPPPARCA
jgi:hypothetical protein